MLWYCAFIYSLIYIIFIHINTPFFFYSIIPKAKKKEWNPKWENAFAPALCNRIDRNTGGIVIAAKSAEALRILNQKVRDRELDKR